MERPLLNGSLTSGDGDYLPVRSFKEIKSVFWIETVKLWKIAAPIVFNTLCQYGINSLGMGSALETLCGQAFGGASSHACPILKLLGQEESVADYAGNFTLLIIPQLFSLAINFPTTKFLQAQSKVTALAWIGFVALILHIPLLWLLIFVFSWGRLARIFWSAFKEIWSFVRLSLASAVMLCLEIWYMMSIIVLTGHLGNAVIAVDSLSICMNFNGWEAMLFIGINAAISVRVSNELGSGHPRAAKYSVYVTQRSASSRLQASISPCLTMVLNSVQPVIGGVAIGSGWQALVAYINIGCYYIFGLPLGFLLGYKANLE
ncbi:hypothetical protein GH714_028731 [Hevea brasiliensis]|uniref:Protein DETOXIFICATION n=1 Tax=Hevea brasiliensis TaxID=3981 RepID=A0A6A6MG37_HEVBR|nr:hypothetical protein GH714_028731 [Hevea brasiliensis]